VPSLAIKLGFAPSVRGLVVGPAPPAVVDQLGGPHRRLGAGTYDVVIAFCPDRAALRRRTETLADRLSTAGALWLAWPKRSSGVATDIGESDVRSAGLAAGLVDNKIAAVDDVWSGLRFVRRLRDR
jgi:hypothetical protein